LTKEGSAGDSKVIVRYRFCQPSAEEKIDLIPKQVRAREMQRGSPILMLCRGPEWGRRRTAIDTRGGTKLSEGEE